MTPEERQRMREQFGGGRGGGRGGAGQNGNAPGGMRGGRGGAAPQQAAVAQPEVVASVPSGEKIDDLFQPTPTRISPGSVWTWDEANKKLTEIRVTTGLTDGQFSQLITGDVKVGQQVVTAVIIPLTTQQRNQQNSLFGNQGRGNFGGMQPGGPPGGFGGPGGGAPGGGGGGGRRGGD